MADVSNLWDLWDQDDMVAAELHKRNLIAQTLLKETESETPKIFQPKSLQKITIDYVLTSRSYNSLQGAVNLYSFLTVRTVDTDESLVALRKHCMELLIKYYPVLVEKVGYEELKAAFQHHPEDFKLMEEKFKSTADSKARFAYLKGTIVEREKVEIDISSPDLEEGLFVCCTTFCYRNLPFARYSCPCCYSLLLSPTVLSRHLLTYILHNLTP